MRFFRGVVGILFVAAFAAKIGFASTPEKSEVVIIGAGLSGLATAYYLHKAHIPYHILEIAPRVGGRVNTVHYKSDGRNVYSDSGMEEYWESNPAIEILKELKLPLRVDVANSSMMLQGKLEMLGEDGGEAFLKRIFNAEDFKSLMAFKAKVAPMITRLHEKPVAKDLLALKNRSFASWVREQVSSARVSEWIRISVECEIGTSWEQISAVDGIAEFHIFIGNHDKGEMSYRVVGGNEKFVDALANAAGRENISTNKRVKSVLKRKDGIHIFYLDGTTNHSGRIIAQRVVSTIPLYRLFEVQFEPSISEKKREAISTQMWGAYFKAHVFLPAGSQKLWIKDKASALPILSDSELGVVYDGNPDQNGRSRILSLLITGRHAEEFNMSPMGDVRVKILAALEKLFPGIGKQVEGIEFYRYHPRAIAAWPPGRSRFDELSDEVRKPENGIYFGGDFTESSHSDGAFLSAKRVAAQIKSDRK